MDEFSLATNAVSGASAAIIAANQATVAASAAAAGPEAGSALDYLSALAAKYDKLLQLAGFLVAALTFLWALVGNPNLLAAFLALFERHVRRFRGHTFGGQDAILFR